MAHRGGTARRASKIGVMRRTVTSGSKRARLDRAGQPSRDREFTAAVAVVVAVVACSAVLAPLRNFFAPMEDLSESENAGLGVFTAVVETSLLQPTLYWKNARQQRLPITLDPRIVYRGIGASLVNEAGQMALQFSLSGRLKELLSDVPAAALGGLLAAAFASPVELVMIQQQRFGGSLLSTPLKIVQSHGVFGAGLFRGLGCAALRDAIYVGGMLGVAPAAQRSMTERGSVGELWAAVGGSILGGLVGGIVSHPFDVVKTCMQGDLAQARYGGVFDAARALHAQGGAARFFDGCFWRTVNITATVLVATACCAVLPPLIKARRKDANSA